MIRRFQCCLQKNFEMVTRFYNRTTAGKQLAQRLFSYANRPSTLVVALPRGGVPVAYEVAKALHLPLDICVVRKLGLPSYKELAMGAIAADGLCVLNDELISALSISDATIKQVARQEAKELARRDRLYRRNCPRPSLKNRTLILIDDGIATGSTMQAAISILKKRGAEHIVVAVPVAPYAVCQELNKSVDRVVCLATPSPFNAIGLWYDNFTQTTDETVTQLLSELQPHKVSSSIVHS